MGLFSFIKNAGEKLFGKDEKEIAQAAQANAADLNAKAAVAIKDYIEKQNLGLVIPPFLIELMGRKSKALLLFKNRWTTIY